MSKTVTLRIDDEIYQIFKTHAEMENRSMSNFIETATTNYIKETDFVDEFEMAGIMTDELLIKKLRNGSKDTKSRRGNFV